jgi:hypothetical protein
MKARSAVDALWSSNAIAGISISTARSIRLFGWKAA